MRAALVQGLFALFVGLMPADSRGATFLFVPVDATGAHTIAGHEITLASGGQRVYLDILLFGWDRNRDADPLLRSWQISIDPSGYENGRGAAIGPALESCDNNFHCQNEFPTTSQCEPVDDVLPGINCAPASIDLSRPDYIFASPNAGLPAVDHITLAYRWAGTTLSGSILDPGFPRYVGSLAVDVPVDARGGYELWLDKPILLNDDHGLISGIELTAARIWIACSTHEDCDDRDACTDDVCDDGSCLHVPNFDDTATCCDPKTGGLCGEPSAAPGDADANGTVDLVDIAWIQRCFDADTSLAQCARLESTCDCRVDRRELYPFSQEITGP